MANQPKRFDIVLYPGFRLTDFCGPVDVINVVSSHISRHPINHDHRVHLSSFYILKMLAYARYACLHNHAAPSPNPCL